MIIALIQQASLTDAPPVSAIGSATAWVSDLLFGPLATAIAIIAIACVGFFMLSGRIDIRRGLSVVVGCFLLFGARDIAEGLRSAALSDNVVMVSSVPPPPAFANPAPKPPAPNGYDPYAGAAVTRPGQ